MNDSHREPAVIRQEIDFARQQAASLQHRLQELEAQADSLRREIFSLIGWNDQHPIDYGHVARLKTELRAAEHWQQHHRLPPARWQLPPAGQENHVVLRVTDRYIVTCVPGQVFENLYDRETGRHRESRPADGVLDVAATLASFETQTENPDNGETP